MSLRNVFAPTESLTTTSKLMFDVYMFRWLKKVNQNLNLLVFDIQTVASTKV